MTRSPQLESCHLGMSLLDRKERNVFRRDVSASSTVFELVMLFTTLTSQLDEASSYIFLLYALFSYPANSLTGLLTELDDTMGKLCDRGWK